MSPWWRRALRIAVAVGVIGLVWRMVDGAEVLARLRAVHPGWIGVALLCLGVQTLLSALRWRMTAARLGHEIGVARAVREYFLAQVVNLSLPGGVLGDAGRALRAGAEAGMEQAGQAVVFDRLAGQAALVLVAMTGAAVVSLVPGGVALPGGFGVVLLIVGAGIGLVVGVALWAGRAWPRLAVWRAAAGRAVFAPDAWPWQLGLSLGTVGLNLLAFAASAAAVGVWLSPAAIMVILPLVLFAMLLPISIGGWGLREGAAVALFPLAGATGAEGFAASACFGVVFLLSALSGLLMFLIPERN